MTRMVQCAKLGKQAEGLDRQMYPGELGKRIYENISKEAWAMWVRQQTMIMNEYRLSPINPQHRAMIEKEMEKFLFGGSSATPEGFVPPKQ